MSLSRDAFPAMGTRIEVSADGAAALPAVRRLFAAREAELSRFRPDSGLSRLNRAAGRPVAVDPVLLRAVERAVAAARATGGAFDPCLGGPMNAIGYDRDFDRLPPDGAAAGGSVRRAGGAWRAIEIDPRAGTVTLPAGAVLDLGGIAKGMTVDEAVAMLRDRGVRSALVSAGGDLAVHGLPPGATGWTIHVRTPRGPIPVALRQGALATSGVERRNWVQGGRRRHHLIDPASGAPARSGLWSATAVAADCERAEAAATAAFVLGAGAGAAVLERLGMDGLLVAPSGGALPIGAWPAREAA